MSQPPLIISGMHRSGTSLLGTVLESAGLFIGWRLQPGHSEAQFFQELNLWLLKEAGGSWEHPGPILDLLATENFREPLVEFLRYNVGTLRAMQFIGPARWIRHRNLANLDEPWGWKDPRTTVTLPLWLDVFPDARVLHIKRHGIDVAASLRTRHARLLADVGPSFERRKWKYQFMAPRQRRATGFQLTSLSAGVDLWSQYEQMAEQHTADLGDRVLTIRYEELLAEPRESLAKIDRFYPLPGDLRDFAGEFDARRAYAHRRDDVLAAAAHEHAGVLARYGY